MIIAPAKNILFGEHSVVYPPNIAVIAANNLACKAEAGFNNSSSIVEVETSGTFTVKTKYEIARLLEYLDSVRKEYEKFKTTADIKYIKRIINKNDDLLKLALAIALEAVQEKGGQLRGFRLYLLSEVPPQSGFGSSAVFSSAVIAAALKAFRLKVSREELFKLVMEIESFQHLNPSGEGPAAVIYGGLITLKRTTEGRPEIEKLEIKNAQLKALMTNITVVHSGIPLQTTGEMVNFVKSYYQTNKKWIKQIEEVAQNFLALNKIDKCEPTQLKSLINSNGEMLEKIGVVGDQAKKFCATVRSANGAAKISGAGGYGDGGSGAILVYHEDRKFIKTMAESYQFQYFDIKFGCEGIQL